MGTFCTIDVYFFCLYWPLVVSDRIARAFHSSGATWTVACDISKAFDRVWHPGIQWNGASCCEFNGEPMENETTTWSEFSNCGKAIVEEILESEERKKSKRAGVWESQSGN